MEHVSPQRDKEKPEEFTNHIDLSVDYLLACTSSCCRNKRGPVSSALPRLEDGAVHDKSLSGERASSPTHTFVRVCSSHLHVKADQRPGAGLPARR